MVDQIFAFGPGHGVIVKLFGQHFAAGEIDPLRQSITVIADTVAHRFGRSRFKIVIHRSRKLGQGKILGGTGLVELAREALASKPMRLEQSAQLSESGVNVQQLHRLPDHAAASLLLRCHEEQGHARTKVVVGEFAPKILFADVKAVIAVQADDCIAIQAESFQFTHHAAHLRIRE